MTTKINSATFKQRPEETGADWHARLEGYREAARKDDKTRKALYSALAKAKKLLHKGGASAAKLAPDKVRTPKGDGASARTVAPDKVRTPDKEGPAEAARLRAEGHSLRAIGAKLGVDQKQVQRWLKAVQGQAVPRRVVGLDGKSYRGSAALPEFNEQANGILTQVLRQWEYLTVVRRAYAAAYRAGRKAARNGEPVKVVEEAIGAAWCAVLSEGELLDESGDSEFCWVVRSLAQCMTAHSLKQFQEGIACDLEDRHYRGFPMNEYDRTKYGTREDADTDEEDEEDADD
jgi:hypothetical protein